ncbi:MAG: prephenate dehydratase [Anaerohalosphaeraceae bacterium]|nr:prephenate dehydratase [Anaerohalosphaeraceae bacterium]
MSLEELRNKIDEIDTKLVELLNARAQVVVEVGKLKGDGPIYIPEREKKVLAKIAASNKGPLPDKTLLAIWRELMSGSFFLERPLRISYLGPAGSFSHTAAIRKFGQSVEYEAVTDIRSIFDEVAKGHCDLGVVPVENSAGGGVIETLDAFVDSNVMICAEVYMPIHHNLMANCSLDEVDKVYSKPEVFAQCRNWLSQTFKDATTIPTASTARAAQLAKDEPLSAAIGSDIAAELYGLNIICENVEDIANNITRFLIISKQDAKPSGDDKTAILFSTSHKAGALAEVLMVFKNRGVNLTNIESRPSRTRQWEYFFFVDCIGHRTDEKVVDCFEDVRRHCLQLSVLGSFPKNDELMEAK